MANVVYNEYKDNMITGAAALPGAANEYAVLLVTSAYSAEEGHLIADVVAEEVASGGTYARQSLAGVTGPTKVEVGGDATGVDDYYKIDATDTAFGPNATITAAGAVIVQLATPGAPPATIGAVTGISAVVTFVDFGGEKSSSNGDFTVVWNANGILNYKQGA